MMHIFFQVAMVVNDIVTAGANPVRFDVTFYDYSARRNRLYAEIKKKEREVDVIAIVLFLSSEFMDVVYSLLNLNHYFQLFLLFFFFWLCS